MIPDLLADPIAWVVLAGAIFQIGLALVVGRVLRGISGDEE